MLSLVPIVAFLATSQAFPTGSSVENEIQSLLITDTPPSVARGCLVNSYYGSYGGKQDEHIYLPTSACLGEGNGLSTVDSGSIVPLSENGGRLVWIGQAGVEGVMDNVAASWIDIEAMALQLTSSATLQGGLEGYTGQAVLGHGKPLSLVHSSSRSIILHVPDNVLPLIDTLLPPHLVPVVLSLSPLPLLSPSGTDEEISASEWKSVPAKYAKHLANLTSTLKFEPKLDKILEGISMNEVRRNIRWLTGEAPSGITSRHSFTPGAIKAGHWIKGQMEETGAECHFEHFLPGFAPNIICTYPSTTNSTEHVILSAHYDSRGSWGSTIAPGGDDDGSGSGHLLAIAQTIGRANVRFEKKVVLAFFAGEEQGLLGSHAFAEKLYNNEEIVLLHVQADMLAYHVPGEPLQLGLPESIHLPEATYLLGNLSHLYSPELLVGRTAACCSDHQSFLSYGFPASAVFERNGPIADPKYHNSGDVTQREGYDFDQVVSIAKVTMASVLTVGGWYL